MLSSRTENEVWFREELSPHEPKLRAWLRSRFSSHCDIDDVVQESYARVLKARGSAELKSPKAYLFATARNLVLDSIRRSNIVQIGSNSDLDQTDRVEDADNIRESIIQNQEIELLFQAIESLPGRCRQVFTLRKLQCLSQSEISLKLGISMNSVATQLKIGVKKCAAYMERHCER